MLQVEAKYTDFMIKITSLYALCYKLENVEVSGNTCRYSTTWNALIVIEN